MSSEFWKEVLSWLKENNIVIDSSNEIGLFLGIFEESEDLLLINHVTLLGKYYIYVRKCLGSLPSLRGFIANTRRVYNIELHIVRERDKLATHFKKWEKLVAALRPSRKLTLSYPTFSSSPVLFRFSFFSFFFFVCVVHLYICMTILCILLNRTAFFSLFCFKVIADRRLKRVFVNKSL